MSKKNKVEHKEIEIPTMIFFSAIDSRRRPEMIDSTLISADHSKIANLPEEFKYGKFDQEYY